MKSHFITLIFICFSTLLTAQHSDFDSDWNKVEKLESEGLTKSASKVVDAIYTKAKAGKNSVQITKALLFQSKYLQILEEDAQLKIVENFKNEIKTQNTVTQRILQNLLAKMYWQYYQNNRYKFYNRSRTSEKLDDDFRTWDLETLFAEVHHYYQLSLQDEKLLQAEPLEKYSELLNEVKDSKIYRPTLFDFLSQNALEFYKTSENSITQPAYKFIIDNSDFSAPSSDFMNLTVEYKDSVNLQLNALKIYQRLLCFHQKDKTSKAFISANTERLNFVKQHATFPNVDKKTLSTLKTEHKAITDNKHSSLYSFEMAKLLVAQASKYNANDKTTIDYRWKNKEALDICNTTISNYPKSDGAENCEVLKEQILNPSFNLKTEAHLPINKEALILVNYKNLQNLNFEIYQVSKSKKEAYLKLYQPEEKRNFLNKLKTNRAFKAELKDEKDYQNHSIELVLPALENSNYIVAAYSKNEVFSTTVIQVTDMALMESQEDDQVTYQVINRNNGAPISGVKAELNYSARYDRNERLQRKFTTDSDGKFVFKKESRTYYDVVVKLNSENDSATFGNSYINRFNERNTNKKPNFRTHLITDRSIYRPGQTVYFKGIATKTENKKTNVVDNANVIVTLYDVNGQELGKLEKQTNDYGSFHGEFILPNGGLTGEFSIRTNSETLGYSSNYISVEEYKRPKFKTKFLPVTETYQVNDSVTVKGNAIAFAGSTITDANVVYRVKRQVQYPSWLYWRRPSYNSSAQEISFGEVKTNAKGEFEITFKAQPDESVSKDNLPVFNFEISADVTDINGETRSAITTVRVGYHALTANLSVPQRLEASEKEAIIGINTSNLNGEFVPAKGSIKVYKLNAPDYVLRSRPWQAPDYKLLSETEFKSKFPHWSYNDEQLIQNWKKGKLEFSTDFNTENSKEITLRRIKNWTSGTYVIILETEDKFGNAVKDQAYTFLENKKDKTLAESKLFSISLDKESYQPNESATITFGSAAENIYVSIDVEKQGKIIQSKMYRLNDSKTEIQIPITQNDLGGFVVHYSYSAFNSFTSSSVRINVPYPSTDLQIETSTFRDKLQPGQDETWSFKIKGSKGDKVTAEVLASMYDASLDEFKSNNWSFNPINRPNYYSRISKNNVLSYGIANFRNINYFKTTKNYSYQGFDSWNWFGFYFGNERLSRRVYRNSIIDAKSKISTSYKSSIKKNTFEGIVTDLSGSALPGVNVIIKGTSTGTQTDFDGKFSLETKKGQTLVFSFVGMKNLEHQISKDNYLQVSLAEDSASLDEVVITGYATTTKAKSSVSSVKVEAEMMESANASFTQTLSGQISSLEITSDNSESENSTLVQLRGVATIKGNTEALFIIDGKQVNEDYFKSLNANDILEIKVLKKNEALAIYGEKGKNGVVLITTKNGKTRTENIQIRKNLQETAFFFPQLQTDKDGNVSFNFKAPEALTKWKLQLLAHTKTLESSVAQFEAVTQKELMVLPNAPRFLRQGDEITISTKIANLSDKKLTGKAQLILEDVVTGKDITGKIVTSTSLSDQEFTVDAKGNTSKEWTLTIPDDIQAVQYKIIARTEEFSDGEQNVLPVLTNRMLVTESLPMWVRSNQNKTFTLDKLANNSSSTLKNHKLTLEITSNPAWYAVQALPYLMEYPYECNEQTFSRYYANALAQHITKSNPKIEAVFNQWKSTNSDELISNLEKNQELKSLLIEETPWLRDAQSETEQKKRIALLFDLNKMNNELQSAIRKLKNNQHNSGAWPWFNGGRDNRYITQHIISGFGHLKKLSVTSSEVEIQMIENAINYLDAEFVKEYKNLKKYNPNVDLNKDHLSYTQLHYLYVRSFYPEIKASNEVSKIIEYYNGQIQKYWLKGSLYAKGLMALVMHRNQDDKTASKILKSLEENSIISEELGMYWKENTASWYWHQAPIETQALMIEAFSEAGSVIQNETKNLEIIDNLKIWLLKNKQTNKWETTKATTEAVYALLLQGSDWLSVEDAVEVTVGNEKVLPSNLDNVKVEAGTGYYKTSWNGSEIKPEQSKVTLFKKGEGIAWGALYWQYFEDLDKITSAETPLKLNKKLFLKTNTDRGEEISEITKNTKLNVGDLIKVRIELRSDRDMEFLHLKDMRAAGFEPVNVLSQYKWQDGLGYYESTKDAATNFFIDYLPKGVYVFEYDLRVNNSGDMSNGITTIQSMYAPEFSSHSEGIRVKVD
ncbi:carboxypeptidase-like regulatory domain-containing protein [Winogradskyella litorisediminis]|uniref:Carboxypeptidase-like regulatory domain-containing protein n=1 Tax=Winogradskyella litorisediminis TaxID=1156618 RepID=A0ABW3NB75_9FLAO